MSFKVGKLRKLTKTEYIHYLLIEETCYLYYTLRNLINEHFEKAAQLKALLKHIREQGYRPQDWNDKKINFITR